MSKKQAGLELALNDNFVSDGLSLIRSKLAELKDIEESVYKTTGKKVPGFSNQVQDETDIGKLIQMHSSVRGRHEAYGKSQEELSIQTAPVFKLEGYGLAEWEADIKLRIRIMQHKETFDQLKEYQKELESLMSNDDRKRILLSRLSKLS